MQGDVFFVFSNDADDPFNDRAFRKKDNFNFQEVPPEGKIVNSTSMGTTVYDKFLAFSQIVNPDPRDPVESSILQAFEWDGSVFRNKAIKNTPKNNSWGIYLGDMTNTGKPTLILAAGNDSESRNPQGIPPGESTILALQMHEDGSGFRDVRNTAGPLFDGTIKTDTYALAPIHFDF